MDHLEIKLPGQLDMSVLADLKEELVSAAADARSLRIDGSAVERASTPAIQLIIATARAFEADGRSFVLGAPSQTLIAALQDLGLEPDYRNWSAS